MNARLYADPNHPGNGPKYRYKRRKCIEPGCGELAGTWWSKLWCFRHNVERMDRISGALAASGEEVT